MRHAFFRLLAVSFSIILSVQGFSQKVPPADWSHKLDKTTVTTGDVITATFTTDIPDGYHIYSNDFSEDCPPQKAKFIFDSHPSFELVGKAKPIGTHRYLDDVFECEVSDFEKRAEFRQKIKVLTKDPTITGILEYQMCTSDGMCVLFEYEFDLSGITVTGANINVEPLPTTPSEPEKPKTEIADSDDGFDADDSILLAEIRSLRSSLEGDVHGDSKYAGAVKAEDVNYQTYRGVEDGEGECKLKTFNGIKQNDSKSYWGFFVLAFISGLAALLTPCVFPMIPMTVSFFMKDGSKAKAIRTGIIYGLSIIVIYVVVGTVVASLAGDSAANWLSTHWIPNVFFFLIFVIFAASFFGAFEIVLPSSWINKMDKKADQGGLAGVFFMAFTIVLVSFSCTGPIVGTILVESANGEILKPIIGMFGFSLAFAIPFTLFAIFPNWLNNLPQSGGWLNSVKVVLGFIELALGLKFLSVADQTYHWGILDREIYIALWIVIFFLMGVYLLGKIKFSHDSDLPFIKVPRLFFAIITFTFVVYLIPGLWGAPLKALAGYMPPMSTHDFNILADEDDGISKLCEKPKYADKLHLPHGLEGYFDFEQGMECARKLGKPVFVDFTGHGCVNCREMEAVVWPDKRVRKLLDEEYIIISLYVDDKTIKLPPDEQYVSKITGRKVTNLAKKNSDIQRCYFDANAQPQYVLLDNEGNMLQPSRNYNLDKDEYVEFLNNGLKEYRARMDQLIAAQEAN
jgi:thiol:disulfide interchange protein DsbD